MSVILRCMIEYKYVVGCKYVKLNKANSKSQTLNVESGFYFIRIVQNFYSEKRIIEKFPSIGYYRFK